LIEIGSKTAEKNSAQTIKQTNKQTNRHNENNGHLAVNQKLLAKQDHCKRWTIISNTAAIFVKWIFAITPTAASACHVFFLITQLGISDPK